MKKTFYKIICDKDNWWICDEKDLHLGIVGWIYDNDGKIRIKIIQMTQEQFDRLPDL